MACRGHEIKYLTRTLVRNLRVGANWRSVLSALGRAAVLFHHYHGAPAGAGEDSDGAAAHGESGGSSKPPTKEALEAGAAAAVDAFHRCPDISKVVAALRAGGVEALSRECGVTVGIPLHPMLAKITEGFEDCVKQVAGSAVLAEYKYDGQRAQIHVGEDGQVSHSGLV